MGLLSPRMKRCCVVPWCSRQTQDFPFPQEESLRKQWLEAIRRPKFAPEALSRVCRAHFNDQDLMKLPPGVNGDDVCWILKPGAVPSRFIWTKVDEPRTGPEVVVEADLDLEEFRFQEPADLVEVMLTVEGSDEDETGGSVQDDFFSHEVFGSI